MPAKRQPLPEPCIFRVNPQTTHQDTRRFITNKGQSITLIATLLYSKKKAKKSGNFMSSLCLLKARTLL